RIPALVMRGRQISNEATLRTLADGHGVVGSWEWTICDFAGQTPTQIRARTLRHVAEHPNSIVLVDYLGLMAPDRARENRTQDV
ncbi:DnaB-like helicase C-terminal domain-containing protein, partial [Lacticaseibacillus paracasei]